MCSPYVAIIEVTNIHHILPKTRITFASNIIFNKVKMLGRKQSLKGEPVLADYGPEESLNESADIEWVNKVNILNYVFKE